MRREISMLLYAIRMTTIILISLCMVSAAAAAPVKKDKRSPKTSNTTKTASLQTSRDRRLPRSRYVKPGTRSQTVMVTRHVHRDTDGVRRPGRRVGLRYTDNDHVRRPGRRAEPRYTDNDRVRRYRRHAEFSDNDRHEYRPGLLMSYNDRPYHDYDRDHYRYRYRFHGYIPLSFGGLRYFYHDGAYYRYTGLGFSLVDDDDIGIYVYSLPFGYRTLFIGGYPYYYVHHRYYIHDRVRNVYVQVNDPNQSVADDDTDSDSYAYHKLVVYPKKGQSAEQEKRDKYECYLWAVKQTGFDPSQGKPGNMQDYQRAKSACLEGRGYVVN